MNQKDVPESPGVPGQDLPTSPLGPFSASDLPLDEQGRIYHLQIKPDQLAPDILIVGDPGRAEMIGSTFLHDIEVEHEHRGLVTITGLSAVSGEPATILSPIKTTVTTSGMGTPSLEIILQELVALNEIDFTTRLPRRRFPRLQIIRVGTSGALQASTRLGTLIITSYSIGMDNTGLYYEAPYPDETCLRLEKDVHQLVNKYMDPGSRSYGKIHPYVSRAEPKVVNALMEAAQRLGTAAKIGLTVSCGGFFAPQGRDIARVSPSLPDLDRIFSDFNPKLADQRIENMEMESSFLNHFLGGLGYWGGAICATIAHRREDRFKHNYQKIVHDSVEVALSALAALRAQYPDGMER